MRRTTCGDDGRVSTTTTTVILCLLLSMPEAELAAADYPELQSNASEWLPATATWYGSPDGDGSDGGACGYGNLVDINPLKKRAGAVSPVLFKGGQGCGACYRVKCLEDGLCSNKPVTVVVMDECPGGYCGSGRTHFDLSGSAFGRMALPGQTSALLNTGVLQILYRRTMCNYPGKNIQFQVNQGSSPYWFEVLIEYEDGDGDVGAVHLKEAGGDGSWQKMNHVWGANWCLIPQGGRPLTAPFSLRVTSLTTKRKLTAKNVIPQGWVPNATYTAQVNFQH